MSLCLGKQIFPTHPFTHEASPPDGQFYPFGLTFEQLIRFYYGARKIKISIPLGWTLSASAGPYSVSDMIPAYETDLLSFNSCWGSNVSREEDYFSEESVLSFGSGTSFVITQVEGGGNNLVDGDGIDREASLDWTLNVTLGMFGAADPIIIYNGLYYPLVHSVTISGNARVAAFDFTVDPPDAADQEFYFEVSNNPIDPPVGTTPHFIGCNFFDQPLTLSGYKYETTTTGSGVVVANISGVPPAGAEVSVGEWWPYDPGDGDGPIWDKETGAKLRNKF